MTSAMISARLQRSPSRRLPSIGTDQVLNVVDSGGVTVAGKASHHALGGPRVCEGGGADLDQRRSGQEILEGVVRICDTPYAQERHRRTLSGPVHRVDPHGTERRSGQTARARPERGAPRVDIDDETGHGVDQSDPVRPGSFGRLGHRTDVGNVRRELDEQRALRGRPGPGYDLVERIGVEGEGQAAKARVVGAGEVEFVPEKAPDGLELFHDAPILVGDMPRHAHEDLESGEVLLHPGQLLLAHALYSRVRQTDRVQHGIAGLDDPGSRVSPPGARALPTSSRGHREHSDRERRPPPRQSRTSRRPEVRGS